MSIKGCCRTNLDEYKRLEWPQEFVAVPQPGELMQARGGRILKVCRVTHYVQFDDKGQNIGPAIEVELTKVL